MTFVWTRFAGDNPNEKNLAGKGVFLAVVGLIASVLFAAFGLYLLIPAGIALIFVGGAVLVPSRARIWCDGDWVKMRPQPLYANTFLWITVGAALGAFGCLGGYFLDSGVSSRIAIYGIVAVPLAAYRAFMVWRNRGVVEVSGDAIIVRGKGFEWNQVAIRRNPGTGTEAEVLLVDPDHSPRPGDTRVAKLARFGAAPYGLDFNSVLSALIQTKQASIAETPLPADQIMAMLTTPAPSPLPAVGTSVNIEIMADPAPTRSA